LVVTNGSHVVCLKGDLAVIARVFILKPTKRSGVIFFQKGVDKIVGPVVSAVKRHKTKLFSWLIKTSHVGKVKVYRTGQVLHVDLTKVAVGERIICICFRQKILLSVDEIESTVLQ